MKPWPDPNEPPMGDYRAFAIVFTIVGLLSLLITAWNLLT